MAALMAAERGVVDTVMVAERGLWMQRWPLSGRVVDAEVVVGAKDIGGGCSDCWGWCTDGG